MGEGPFGSDGIRGRLALMQIAGHQERALLGIFPPKKYENYRRSSTMDGIHAVLLSRVRTNMIHRSVLMDWVRDALVAHGGQARIVQVSKHIWENHESKLRDSGELFYTWQYDFRWAAERLRKKKIMKPADQSPKGIWELA